jgi:hypothetical protein
MAQTAKDEPRMQLLEMAEMWERLAEARLQILKKSGLTEEQDDGRDFSS